MIDEDEVYAHKPNLQAWNRRAWHAWKQQESTATVVSFVLAVLLLFFDPPSTAFNAPSVVHSKYLLVIGLI